MVDLHIFPLNKKIDFQASKWLKLQVLLDKEEFVNLLTESKAQLFEIAGPLSLEQAAGRYQQYVEALSQGQTPPFDLFAWNWTLDPSALYLLDTGVSKQVRIRKPVVQIGFHQMNYTPEDQTFRSNLFGHEMITWGLQFAFPQLYQDDETHEVHTVKNSQEFPNVALFRFLQKWLRENTIPTPFEQCNASQRIGKKALSWIHRHPDLVKKGFKVKIDALQKSHFNE